MLQNHTNQPVFQCPDLSTAQAVVCSITTCHMAHVHKASQLHYSNPKFSQESVETPQNSCIFIIERDFPDNCFFEFLFDTEEVLLC